LQLFELLRVVEDIRLAPEVLEPDPVDIAGKFRNKYIKDKGTFCHKDYKEFKRTVFITVPRCCGF
jgi:hypothetical protein